MSIRGEHARGEQPRRGVAAGLAVFGREIGGGERAEMGEEFFQASDALAGGADVAALAAVGATFAGEAIVCLEGDDTGTEELGGSGRACLKNGPADGAVPYVEGEV